MSLKMSGNDKTVAWCWFCVCACIVGSVWGIAWLCVNISAKNRISEKQFIDAGFVPCSGENWVKAR